MDNLVALSCESEATMLGYLLAWSFGFMVAIIVAVLAHKDDNKKK
jgi:hypothetical protein